MEFDLWSKIASPAILQRLWFTLWESGLTVISALIIGGGLAVIERLKKYSSPRWFILVCSLPLFLPPAIVSTGFIQLLGRAGDINDLLGFFNLPSAQFLYTPAAVLIVHAYYNIPLAYLGIRMALDGVSRHFDDVAWICGANTFQYMRDVLWPRIKIAVIGIAGIIFLYSFTSFIIPLQIGGIRAQTLEVWLFQSIYLFHDYTEAIGLALIQSIVLGCVLLFAVRGRLVASDRLVPSPASHPPFSMVIYWSVAALGLFAPLISLVLHGLGSSQWSSFVMLWRVGFFSAIGRSLLLAFIVVVVTLIVVLFLRIRFSWTFLLLTISPVTLGFLWLLIVGKGYVSLLAALLIGFLPIASYVIDHGLKQRPRFFSETAKCLGANIWQRRRLEVSFLRPSILHVIAFGCVFVLGDITLARLLAPITAPTGMQVAVGFISNYRFQLGSLAIVIVLVVIGVLQSLIYARR